MKKAEIFYNDQKLKFQSNSVCGEFIKLQADNFYKIHNYDKIDPFLISIVSASDHWMYVSSLGGITAGRRNPDSSFFPYINDDQLNDVGEITGSKTIIKIIDGSKIFLWEPFSERYHGVYSISRNLYKNISGTKIIFEEINNDLNLIFKYGWTTSHKYGFVKFSEIINCTGKEKKIEILDGIQNVLPSGLDLKIQTEFSTLVNGYKKNELIENAGLGVFSLSSIPSDLPQPSESLTATVVYSVGIDAHKILLCSRQLEKFRSNLDLEQETSIKGIRAAYFVNSSKKIKHGASLNWYLIAEVNQNAGDIAKIIRELKDENLQSLVSEDIHQNQVSLNKIIAQADGIQLTEKKLTVACHFSNVVFNVMRGGVFDESYFIDTKDFFSFIKNANPFIVDAHKEFFDLLPERILHSELVTQVRVLGDTHFNRLVLEYLPLTFSRRHGDPSRPWNKFSIEIKNEKNEKVLNYQGNWRDIFQNWEALALSYPKFLESMISKFLNTSTADGYNPYRIFRDGFDWEIQEAHNPWSNIGYWGDHQIIYLLKLLELSQRFNPGALEKFYDENIFTYANVPYRIKAYNEIINNPRDTIVFDFELDRRLKSEEEKYGSDVKYLKRSNNSLLQTNLIEKLLLTLLVKISNFIPGGGIWMNTQRPEWNDANNALAGYGVSMVTLYYIRRYVIFFKDFLNRIDSSEYKIAFEVSSFFDGICKVLNSLQMRGEVPCSNELRKNIVDDFQNVASEYRTKIYKEGFSEVTINISKEKIIGFFDSCLFSIDETIKLNKREDGLYNSYNIMHLSNNEIGISNLYVMLEGQVAILSSDYLSADESIMLLNALKRSSLYRKDLNSYMLYPNIELPLFIHKNNIKKSLVENSELFKLMIADGCNDIIYSDVDGTYHFQNDLLNAQLLAKKLNALKSNSKFEFYVRKEFDLILEIYEITFEHKKFTGRATTFYKYEGLGCIYWHMVSKLCLAVQELYLKAELNNEEKENLIELKKIYYDIREGIATEVSLSKHGAFPMDPYSHTPAFSGAQQPGMTGKVKEDIICRLQELGIIIKSGEILIYPTLLKPEEFIKETDSFVYFNLDGVEEIIKCSEKSIAFTFCQVPFIYTLSDANKIIVHLSDHKKININELKFGESLSQSIFNREGKILQVEVSLDQKIFEG